MRKKVTVVGAGHVGATIALRLVENQLADVVLVDILEGIPQGKALDLLEAGPVQGYDFMLTGSNDYKSTQDSDIVVITAGLPRKSGMSRDDLLLKNAGIVKAVTTEVAQNSPEAVIIVVSNPLDAMCQVVYRVSGFPRERVIGMAGVLDSSRFKYFLSQELKVPVKSINTLVLGGHGDTMVPMPDHTTVNGKPIKKMIKKEKLDLIIERTRKGGAEIIKYLGKGSAYYAPATSGIEMAESYIKDLKKTLPCAAYLNGEYGVKNLYLGVPVKIGKNGVEQIIEIELSEEEKKQFNHSINAVQELFAEAKKIDNNLK